MLRKFLKKVFKYFKGYSGAGSYLPLLNRSEVRRIKSLKRKKLDKTSLFNRQVSFPDGFWFLHSVDEIFIRQVYKFICDNDTPYILDCGANIGLSVIYFKKLFPQAVITAFEADPAITDLLKKNTEHFEHVNVISGAVWHENGKLAFFAEGSIGGMIAQGSTPKRNQVEVPAIRLRDFLDRPVDFLKIDIEGAEFEVLKDCKDSLGSVKNMFIEYHAMPNEPQTLHLMLEWVTAAGFNYYIKEAWNNMTYPFLKSYNGYFHMQLNIFCFRQDPTEVRPN
jgi:FkbM family methyltransferase